jgi:DNA repair ATPase RecN
MAITSRPARTKANASRRDMAPTGITVVTGFLGAGKTTLVNYVLHADHGYRGACHRLASGCDARVRFLLECLSRRALTPREAPV